MKKLAGQLSINAYHGESQGITIRLTDKDSSTTAVEIDIDFETFGRCISGHSYLDCTFEFNDSGIVGKIMEHKEEIVPGTKPWDRDGAGGKKAIAAMKKFEVDGWEGRKDDLFNGHRSTPKGQLVTFVRYVEKAAEN